MGLPDGLAVDYRAPEVDSVADALRLCRAEVGGAAREAVDRALGDLETLDACIQRSRRARMAADLARERDRQDMLKRAEEVAVRAYAAGWREHRELVESGR